MTSSSRSGRLRDTLHFPLPALTAGCLEPSRQLEAAAASLWIPLPHRIFVSGDFYEGTFYLTNSAPKVLLLSLILYPEIFRYYIAKRI